MRSLSLILCLASPALADGLALETCATDPGRDCLVEATLPGLTPLQAPLVLAASDRLTLLAAIDGYPAAVELSLADGSALRTLPLRLPSPGLDASGGLIGQGASGYALLLWQGGTLLGLQFFGPEGAPLGLLSSPPPDDWPLDLRLDEALLLLAGQGVLTFDGVALAGTLYRFRLQVRAADGALTVTETRPGTGAGDSLGAYLARRLERQIDPVGAEAVQVEGRLAAVTVQASDGAPSRLLVRSGDGGEVAFDQRLGPERMDFDYSAARVAPDGARLAAIRTSAAGEARLMVFEIETTAPLFEAALPVALRSSLLWLPGGRIAVLQDDGDGSARLWLFQTP